MQISSFIRTGIMAALCATAPVSLQATEDTHLAVAKELVALSSPREIFVTSFMTAFTPMVQGMRASGLPEEKVAQVEAAAQKLALRVAEDPDLTDQMAAVYVEDFSEGELKEIIAFYKTPVGRKALVQLPQTMQKGAEIGQKIMAKYEPEFRQELESILKKEP